MLPSDPSLAPAIAHAEEVAKILRENVVQGKKGEDDRYSKSFPSPPCPSLSPIPAN
jgi:hypothetical protein